MKHIVITGANGSLGTEVARRFLERGDSVSAIVSQRAPEDYLTHDRLESYRADLTDEEATRSVIEEIRRRGQVDAAVLTVGGFGMGTLEKTSLSGFEKMYRLNFVTAYNSTRPLVSMMKEQPEGGQIIYVGARPGLDPSAAPKMVGYSLSKSLVFRLAEVVNEEGEPHRVTASVVVPSIIDTPGNRKAMPGADFSRWVTPEEIATHILHLVTPAGKKLRRTVLKVYGES